MNQPQTIDLSSSTRVLRRILRAPPDLRPEGNSSLPESLLWQSWVELRRRGEPNADAEFLRSLRGLHRRRSIGGAELPLEDVDTDEHRLVDDPMLAELWRAYKKCVCGQRTGPASQLLQDIEGQLQGN